MNHKELHRTQRSGWLRAAVLGANDGAVSTASLLIGVTAAHAGKESILIAGVAALTAGAMAMAAGEYVSVSSQADLERADLTMEREALDSDFDAEHEELAGIYVGRGLDPKLAHEVARQLMAHDALSAHARDELGITESLRARPFEAALASGAAFIVGALVPLTAVIAAPESMELYVVALVSLTFLAVLGAIAARAGGARMFGGAARVLVWGAAAMIVTAGVGALIGRVA